MVTPCLPPPILNMMLTESAQQVLLDSIEARPGKSADRSLLVDLLGLL